LLEPEPCLVGEGAHRGVSVEDDHARGVIRYGRRGGFAQQPVAQPLGDVAADTCDKSNLLVVEVRLALAAYEGDAAPARVTGAEHGAQLGAEAERSMDAAVAGGTGRPPRGLAVPRPHWGWGAGGSPETCDT